MAIKVEIRNLEKLTSLASRYPKISQKYIDEAIVRSIGTIARETKPNVPVKTGRLVNSMVPIFRPFKGVLPFPVKYANRVHNMYPAGTPYKRPSLNKSAKAGFLTLGVSASDGAIQDAFDSALDKIVGELAR